VHRVTEVRVLTDAGGERPGDRVEERRPLPATRLLGTRVATAGVSGRSGIRRRVNEMTPR
jgi:hypothetical protein